MKERRLNPRLIGVGPVILIFLTRLFAEFCVLFKILHVRFFFRNGSNRVANDSHEPRKLQKSGKLEY